MGFDMDFIVVRVPDVHDKSRICFNYEREPNRCDLREDVCGRFVEGEVDAVMRMHFEPKEATARWCPRCRFMTRMSCPLDTQHVHHAYRNPILDSGWFLNNMNVSVLGPTAELFNASDGFRSEWLPDRVEGAIATLEGATPMRPHDAEARDESLAVLRWARDWFCSTGFDPGVAILVTSDW